MNPYITTYGTRTNNIYGIKRYERGPMKQNERYPALLILILYFDLYLHMIHSDRHQWRTLFASKQVLFHKQLH